MSANPPEPAGPGGQLGVASAILLAQGRWAPARPGRGGGVIIDGGCTEGGAQVYMHVYAFQPTELATQVSAQNVVLLNDLAYYLDEAGNSRPAAILLKAIHAGFPDRVVAKLNLADAYCKLGDKSGARELYRDYQSDMKQQGKASKIPARVFQRVKVTE